MGGGRTADDTGAVFLPQAKVLFAGPASVNGPRVKLPGSDVTGWISTLASLRKLDSARVVPGFGSWSDSSILERQRLLLSEARRQVAYQVAMAIPLARMEIVLPASFFAWAS